MLRFVIWFGLTLAVCAGRVAGQELPYFVTYSHHMEEPGSLEMESKLTSGEPKGGGRFAGFPVELEYGTRAWWTTELYLEGQSTANESTLFTGFRIENRIRPLLRELPVNPVFYFEFEDINGANKSLLEVVGHDGTDDVSGLNSDTRTEKKREVELKLILSSNAKGWNFSENFIAEKSIGHAPWEFGYALAASRPLLLEGSAKATAFSLENFSTGVEMYGGLGDTQVLSLGETSHYIGPVFNWSLPSGVTMSASPNFGITDHSLSRVYRFGVAYEIGQVSRFFRSHKGGKS